MIVRFLTIVALFGTLGALAQNKDIKRSEAQAKDQGVKIDYHKVGAPLPPVKLVSIDTLSRQLTGRALKKANRKNLKKLGYEPVTTVYTNSDLDNGKTLFMMMFNPTCGHCEDMTDMLEKNIGRLQGCKLALVANPVVKGYLADFIKNHKVKDFYPNIVIGVDSAGFIENTNAYSALPQISVYSSDRKLLKVYSGEVQVDSLVRYIQ